jgi:2-C-methyl-D-erythritol 4-phosphate cytidylyltransferase
MTGEKLNILAVVPAAGVGRRMGGSLPKQYMDLLGVPVIVRTLCRIAGHPRIQRTAVVLAPNDVWFSECREKVPQSCVVVEGGKERCHSVLAGIELLSEEYPAESWIIVHDAARPCVREEDIDALLDGLFDSRVGGILAVPAEDTLKRCDNERNILKTVKRENVWKAFTPQMFRLGLLRDALRFSISEDLVVTDEAQAIEAFGETPQVVPGHSDNIKITKSEDLKLAGAIIAMQEEEFECE